MEDRRQAHNIRRIEDPTPNVLLILNSEVKRLEQLMQEHKDISERSINRRFEQAEKDLLTSEKHSAELSGRETKRLDDIITNIRETSIEDTKQAVATAATLQGTVASTAEAARIKLEATELALRSQNIQSTEALARINATQNENYDKRFKVLEEGRSEGLGKERIADPLILQLRDDMQAVKKAQEVGAGKFLGAADMWKIIVATSIAAYTIHSFLPKG